jgi:hypothetical protein
MNYAISLVHQDTQHMRETLDIHTAALERQERRLDRHGELLGSINDRLDRHGDALAEILRRLPGGPSNGPSGGQDDH